MPNEKLRKQKSPGIDQTPTNLDGWLTVHLNITLV
jgi:hypothetical protein